jgi:GxxExxY protein
MGVSMGMDGIFPHKSLTEKIIGAAFRVHNQIGPFFVEKIYEKALIQELTAMGVAVEGQKHLTVNYGGKPIGDFVVDVLVEEKVIVEIKAVPWILTAHIEKVLHYLKTSGIELGLILNFSRSVQIKRVIHTRLGNRE